MTGVRFRRAPLLLTILVALAMGAAGCNSGASTNVDKNGIACDHWCGSGSATATMAGATTTILGGGCYDQGSAGVDARFGDWQSLQGASDYLEVLAFRSGGATPTPVPTPVPTASSQASPSATEHPGDSVSGAVDGSAFILGTDTVVTLNADGTGSYHGTDDNGAGLISGTFTCR
jgi:hypothetical protein